MTWWELAGAFAVGVAAGIGGLYLLARALEWREERRWRRAKAKQR